eukprot:TRINITY_DN5208_c0_g3_i1.p1 TRINITY_DN5208_c0_g3~~TRINITY_DN5208_c0_g3_i1.p1  ORF type:complete len:575 (-),score=65.05 TRINITY_DN5208_c0_g3_i1:171-1895(-)
MLSAEEEEQECCVCYGQTTSRTPCGHLLCNVCSVLLPRAICPMCRNALPGLAAQLSARSAPPRLPGRPGRSIRRAVPLRGARLSSVPPPPPPPAAPQAVPVDAAQVQRSTPHRQSSLGPTSTPRRGRTGSTPTQNGSPFLDWLRRRDEQGDSPRHQLQQVRGRDEGGYATAGSARVMRITELVSRIGRMAFHEMTRFVNHVAWLQEGGLVDSGNGAVLQQALRRRMAELFSVAPLQSLRSAGDALEQLELCQGSPCEPLRRAIEARLSYLFYNPKGETVREVREFPLAPLAQQPPEPSSSKSLSLEELHLHHACVADLAQRRLIGKEAHATSVSHLRQWLEKASVVQFANHRSIVGELIDSEPSLLSVLSQRMRKMLRNQLSTEALGRFLHTALDLQESMQAFLLDSSFEEAVHKQLRSGISGQGNEVVQSTWPPKGMAMLLEEVPNSRLSAASGGLLRYCRRHSNARHEVRPLLLSRFTQEVAQATSSSVRKAEDLPRVQAELEGWRQLALRASASGLISFDTQTRNAVIDSVSKFTARCMASPELNSYSIKIVQGIEWSLLLLVGAHAESNC